jgi:hypothetical protein
MFAYITITYRQKISAPQMRVRSFFLQVHLLVLYLISTSGELGVRTFQKSSALNIWFWSTFCKLMSKIGAREQHLPLGLIDRLRVTALIDKQNHLLASCIPYYRPQTSLKTSFSSTNAFAMTVFVSRTQNMTRLLIRVSILHFLEHKGRLFL